MNRKEVILTIRTVGRQFSRVMACLCGPEYASGYNQACNDMIRLFNYAPLEADFEAERAELHRRLSVLAEEKRGLKQALNERDATIEKLLKHVDICKVLGIKDVKR